MTKQRVRYPIPNVNVTERNWYFKFQIFFQLDIKTARFTNYIKKNNNGL